MTFNFEDDPFTRSGPVPPAGEDVDRAEPTIGQIDAVDDVQAAPVISGPPVGLLLGAAVTGSVALGLAPWGPVPVLPVAAWVIAGPVTILLLGAFLSVDMRRRASWLYQSPAWVPWVARALPILVLIGVGLSAWRVADWAARR